MDVSLGNFSRFFLKPFEKYVKCGATHIDIGPRLNKKCIHCIYFQYKWVFKEFVACLKIQLGFLIEGEIYF